MFLEGNKKYFPDIISSLELSITIDKCLESKCFVHMVVYKPSRAQLFKANDVVS